MSQIGIGAAAQTALKEALKKFEKKRRFLLDCQLVIKTKILNLIEKTPLQYNLVKLASCLVLKQIVRNHETANRFRLTIDGFSSHKKITSKIADNAKFQFNEIQKLFVKSILMNSSNLITLKIDWMFS